MSEDDGLAGTGAIVAVTKAIYSFAGKKILVLGSTGHAGVTCTPWVGAELPNIVDFDVCVVNTKSLTDKDLAATKHEHFENIARKLSRLLMSNGTLIVILDNIRSVKTPKQYPESTNNFRWFPLNLKMWTESGDTVEILENVFSMYLSKLKRWDSYHLCTGLGDGLESYLGTGGQYRFRTEVIARNREGQSLASTYQVDFFKGQKKWSSSGPIILLPSLPDVDESEAVALALQDIGVVQIAMSPTWAQTIEVPGMSDLGAEIETLTTSLGAIKGKIAERELQLAKLKRYTELLYATGSQLEEIFRESLVSLGANVIEAKYATEEYILEWRKQEFLIEVKGNTKSISLDNVRQLLDYTIHYLKDTGKDGKGILFGNAWRLLPVGERDKSGNPIFPDDVKKTAQKHGIALVSSTAYFDAFCQYLRGEISHELILDRMTGGSGVISF